MNKNMRDALKYAAMLCDAALVRADDGKQRENALRYFKSLVKNMIEEGCTLGDAAKMFPTQRAIFVDVYNTCLREMGENEQADSHDFNTRS
jgi:hypothetical protein